MFRINRVNDYFGINKKCMFVCFHGADITLFYYTRLNSLQKTQTNITGHIELCFIK